MPVNVRTAHIGWGTWGTHETLGLMRQLANSGLQSPAVVGLARRLAVSGGVRQQYHQALAIRSWLASVWRFVADPVDGELLLDPDALLSDYQSHGTIAGDCDEAAILGASLGKAVGIPATFTVLAFGQPGDVGPAPYEHVFATLLTDDAREVSLDVTRPRGPVPPVTRQMSVAV